MEVFSTAITTLSLALRLVDQARKFYLEAVAEIAAKYRRERLGRFQFLSSLGLLDMVEVQAAQWNINCWKDEEIMQWKRTYTDGCNAVAIAVSRLLTKQKQTRLKLSREPSLQVLAFQLCSFRTWTMCTGRFVHVARLAWYSVFFQSLPQHP